MIYFSNIFEVLMVLLYPIESFFLIFASKKCFFEKLPVWKGVLIFFLSPSTVQLTVNYSFGMVANDNNMEDLLTYCILKTCMLFVLQLVFLFFYVKLIHAKNQSIAMFLYLCGTVLTPGSDLNQILISPILPLIGTIVLLVAFYLFVVRSLAQITGERQDTDLKLFVIPPAIVFVYRTIILFLSMYILGNDSEAIDGSLKLMQKLREDGGESQQIFKSVFQLFSKDMLTQPYIVYVSDLSILLVLIVAFYVITRDINYMKHAKKAHEETKTLAVEMMEALAHTIDAKDPYTKGHSVRVAKYSRMIAQKMGLSEKECESVYYYGLLHDLGKIGVPNEIINSPNKLTKEEYDKIKEHPVIGYDILEEVHSRPDLTIGARWHHERYDGKGYPDGKAGDDIPLLARIITVADGYDAMTSNRSYRKYMPQDKVKAEIKANSGTQFDPRIAEKMLEIMDEDKEYTLHE